ncbi:DUF6502 family protein [Caldimonas sp. KR1-144]|uniref:DUF6502 family protein n=1 Tax=Caldimonas sp. KR1-144 TaxID=3400911 RepID=UPI003C076947
MRSPRSAPGLSLPATAASGEADALERAISDVLQPLARLAVAKGMPFAVVEDLLKRAFVRAALEAHAPLAPHRAVSRIATATGLNRREVTRLTQTEPAPPARRPVAAELFARWASDPLYRDGRGRPRSLPRQGVAPSFESLAQSVTRDVHPRSLLDELQRLGLAVHDPDSDTVALVRDAFVPRGDAQRMLGFLGDNVGDHLGAAVANVLGDGRAHFEQAIFADELSEASLAVLRELISGQWRAISSALVPAIEQRIEHDRAAGSPSDRRMRIGLYTFTDRMDGASAPSASLSSPGAVGGPKTN